MCGPIQAKPFVPSQGCGGGGAVQEQPHQHQSATQTAGGSHAHAGAAALGGGGTSGMSGMSGSHASHETTRTAPVDRARAQRVFDATLRLLGNLTYAQTSSAPMNEPNGTHRAIPASVIAQWRREYPDLPVPTTIVFSQKGGGRVVGANFVGGRNQPVDLGMGAGHQHQAGKPVMQHVWLTPGNRDLAFSDLTNEALATKTALNR
jgi:hypothetical protein